MKRGIRILARVIFAISVVLLVAAAVAPFISADWLGEPVGSAIAEALERRVEIQGPVRWKLFGGPGLTFGDVVIHDERSMGLEPLAYVDSLEVGFGLSSLWRGHLAFSYLRMVEPSVNLVKNAEGNWNYPELLERAFGGSQREAARLPRIQVRSGRLNFKYGDTKSVFCFTGTDMDVWPDESDPEAVVVRFEGKPARTDRPAQSFGDVSGGGRLMLPNEGESRVNWNLRMQRSSISELLTLMMGQRSGLEGFVTSSAQLEGPLSDINITGQLRLAEFNQRSLLPAAPEPLMRFRGRLDVPGERLQLSTVSDDEAALPLAVEIRASDYLVQPDWRIVFGLQRLPIDALPPVALEMGLAMPDVAGWDGLLSGVVEWSQLEGVRGALTIEQAEMRAGEVGLGVDVAEVTLEGSRVEIPETTVRVGAGQTVQLAATYDRESEELRVVLASEGLSIADHAEVWRRVTGSEPPSMLDQFQSGVFSGRLVMLRQARAEPQWSGEIALTGARVTIDGLSNEFEVESAAAVLTDDGFRITELRGDLGGLAVEARYERSDTAERPHRLELIIEEAEASVLGELLQPSLARSRRGLIARTLRLGPAPPPPEWLSSRRASGSLRIGELSAGSVRFADFTFDFYWDGARIELVNLRSAINQAVLEGSASVDLSTASPEYLVRAAVHDLPWRGGSVEAEGRLRSSGLGLEVVGNAYAEGSFLARQIRSESGEVLREVSGCYELRASGILGRLVLPCIRLRSEAATYHGWGEGDLLGQIDLDLFSGENRAHASARLAPFDVEVSPREERLR